MDQIPITFEFKGKTYSGHFLKVSGAANSALFHLMVEHHYYGQLWFSDRWRFESPSMPEMRELAEEFGAVVTAWYE